MPKKKTTAIVRPLKPETSAARTPFKPPSRAKLVPIESAAPAVKNQEPLAVVDDLSQFPSVFQNKAGRYELIRVEGGQAYYSFTNRFDKTVDATMSVIMWRKMQERASA